MPWRGEDAFFFRQAVVPLRLRGMAGALLLLGSGKAARSNNNRAGADITLHRMDGCPSYAVVGSSLQ